MANLIDLNALFMEEEGENVIVEDEADAASELLRHAAHVLEGNEDSHPVGEPTIGLEFDSGEQFCALCYTYAYKTGFELHVRSSELLAPFRQQGIRRNGVGDNEPRFHMMKKIRLACSEGNTAKKSPSEKPCPMFIFGKIDNESGKFVIRTDNYEHNHLVNPEFSRHVVSYRHIGEYFKSRLLLNDRAGIPITRNFNTIAREAGGIENLGFNSKDARNLINKERRKTRLRGDALEVLNYFERLKAQNPDFYYAYKKDADNKLLNIFWSDARCRAMYKAFGDPISFDSTFLSNRYQLPFCPFVGVNHHGSTVLFAAALISHEDTESFEWVFRKWRECMGSAPTVLLTDQCKAMEGAIKSVFPETKHRLCLWHILQNADKNLRSLQLFPQIDKDLRSLVHESHTEDELEGMWEEFMDKYNLRRNRWLSENIKLP